MTHAVVVDGGAVQVLIDGIDAGSRNAKGIPNALLNQDLNQSLRNLHVKNLLKIWRVAKTLAKAGAHQLTCAHLL